MNDEDFTIPEYYVLSQMRRTVSLRHGTGLIISILVNHTEAGTGITREELRNEAFHSRIGQELTRRGQCILDPGHRSNRVNHVLSTLRSRHYFPDRPAVELRDGRFFLTRV